MTPPTWGRRRRGEQARARLPRVERLTLLLLLLVLVAIALLRRPGAHGRAAPRALLAAGAARQVVEHLGGDEASKTHAPVEAGTARDATDPTNEKSVF